MSRISFAWTSGGLVSPLKKLVTMMPYRTLLTTLRDLLDRDVADSPLGDHVAIELPPSLNVDLAMLEVRRPFAILEIGPLLDQELDERRVLGEELQERGDRPLHPLQPVADARDLCIDLLLELAHHPIRRGQEQRPLAGEVAIDRPLAHPQPIRQRLGHRVGEPMLGKQLGRCLKDLLPTRQVRFLRATSRLFVCHVSHGPLLITD